jgi:hypothetical protein
MQDREVDLPSDTRSGVVRAVFRARHLAVTLARLLGRELSPPCISRRGAINQGSPILRNAWSLGDVEAHLGSHLSLP